MEFYPRMSAPPGLPLIKIYLHLSVVNFPKIILDKPKSWNRKREHFFKLTVKSISIILFLAVPKKFKIQSFPDKVSRRSTPDFLPTDSFILFHWILLIALYVWYLAQVEIANGLGWSYHTVPSVYGWNEER